MASSAQLQLMVATITHCSVAAGVTAAGGGAGDERVNDAATGASTNHAAAPT